MFLNDCLRRDRAISLQNNSSVSGTSIGANAQEALAAHSKNDFIYKNSIALREARETNYWLRLINEANLSSNPELDALRGESEQITKIFGAIVTKARGITREAD